MRYGNLGTLSILVVPREKRDSNKGVMWDLAQMVRDFCEKKCTNLGDFNLERLRNTRAKNIRNNFQNGKMEINLLRLRQWTAFVGVMRWSSCLKG